MEKLKKYFETIGFQGNDLEQILDAFTRKAFNKNDFVVEEGKVSKHLGFVEHGAFQYFVYKDGEEKTTYVSIQNTWLSSLLSFVRQVPSSDKTSHIPCREAWQYC